MDTRDPDVRPLPQVLQNAMARLGELVVDDAKAAEVEAVQREAAALERRIRRAAVLERERISLDASVQRALLFDTTLQPTRALQAVQQWVADPRAPAILVLSGTVGCGKTVAAAWALLQREHSCLWRSAAAVTRAFMRCFETDDQDRICACNFLVIDDVGASAHEPQQLTAALVEIAERRKDKRTIITTNLSRKAFGESYNDQRLRSRFANGRMAWVGGSDADLRGVVKP